MQVRFVSLVEKRQIQGIGQITDLMNDQGFAVDHFEYKVLKKSEIRRPINPKLKNSPTEKVTIEERLNVNANLKSVGQLEWRVLKDPENVLLLQIQRIKGDALSLPLFFNGIFSKERQILITGLTNAIKLQLTAKPDLKFQRIPEAIAQDTNVKEQLIHRASRSKGMQATARELLDFPGLPEEITRKIVAIATGKKEKLNDAEAINLILMSDLHSRYAPVFETFQSEIIERKTAVAQLARQFSILTQKISTRFLVGKLIDFLGENAPKCKNNQQIFTYLYQKLQQMEEQKIYVNKKLLDRKDLFKLLRSIICIARSQYDADLWQKCFYFLNPDDEQTLPEENEKTLSTLVSSLKGRLVTKETKISGNLTEIFLINNIAEYVLEEKVSIDDNAVSKQESGLIKSIVAPRLHVKVKKGSSQNDTEALFHEPKQGIQKLINSVHFVASAYGFLCGELIKKNLGRFLVQEKKTLIERFGEHFFDILYEQAIFESGLPLSRNQFAEWLKEIQLVAKPEELGYIPNEIESEFDPALTAGVLTGNALTTLSPTMSNEDFEKEYVTKRNAVLMFFNKITKGSSQNSEFSPFPIFQDYVSKGKYNLRSASFRNHVRETFLYEELSELVKLACAEIRTEVVEKANNKKIILQLPLKYHNLLFLGNTFDIPTGKLIIQARIHTITVNQLGEDRELSHRFATAFSKLLQETKTEKQQGLIQAMRIIGEYHKVSLEYIKLLTIVFMDRHLHRVILKQKLVNRDPRFLKFKMPDVDKLAIGSVRDINLNKIYQYNSPAAARDSSKIIQNQSFGELVQSVIYYNSVIESIESRKETVEEVKLLLSRFSNSMKKSKEWLSYSSIAGRIGDLISLPLHAMSEKVIKTLMDLSLKLNRLVTKHEYKNSVIAILHAEWKRSHPERSKDIYFYISFLGDDAPKGKTNLLLEIRKARDLIKMLRSKRAVVFFPGATKEIQLNQMIEIKNFIKEQNLNPEIYIETRTLDEGKIRELSKEFYPTGFFNIDKLEPVKMPMKQKLTGKPA